MTRVSRALSDLELARMDLTQSLPHVSVGRAIVVTVVLVAALLLGMRASAMMAVLLFAMLAG